MKLLRYLAGLIGAWLLAIAAAVFAGLHNWTWFAVLALLAIMVLVLWVGTVLANRLEQLTVIPPVLPDEGPRYIGDR